MNKYIKNIIPSALFLLAAGMTTSCVNDLDVEPIDPNLVAANAEGHYNKCFSNLSLVGNGGPDGDCDIDGLDGGTSSLIRQMFNTNELTTDEAICGWGDTGIPEFCYNTYDASHPMINGYYYRLYFGITLCNDYLRQYSEHNEEMTAEIRFLRALEYYLAMDAFGNIPLFRSVGDPDAKQVSRKEIFEFIESELLEIEPLLSAARAKNSSDPYYGRPDKAAAWMLLMRLYLNAEVYTGTAQWAKAAEYAKKVIDSPYKLNTSSVNGYSAYQMLFMGDNGESSASTECVFAILQDGLTTASYGMHFLKAAALTGDMDTDPNEEGVFPDGDNGWGGNRARPDLVAKFFPNNDAPEVSSVDMPVVAGDDRAILWGKDRTLNVETVSDFKSGYSVPKFTDYKSDRSARHDAKFSDFDFFFFRAAEAYLAYAEATARQNGGGTTAEGAGYINQLRSRAHASSKIGYSLDDILDEWSREFYFEGRRRVDLIRFGKFGGNTNYTWQWKGGSYEGTNFNANKNVFALPDKEILNSLTTATPYIQNPGY